MARIFQPKKKTQLNTRHQAVQVERLDHHGAGIAYLKKNRCLLMAHCREKKSSHN